MSRICWQGDVTQKSVKQTGRKTMATCLRVWECEAVVKTKPGMLLYPVRAICPAHLIFLNLVTPMILVTPFTFSVYKCNFSGFKVKLSVDIIHSITGTQYGTKRRIWLRQRLAPTGLISRAPILFTHSLGHPYLRLFFFIWPACSIRPATWNFHSLSFNKELYLLIKLIGNSA
jgi:hypothetical protein